MRLRYIYFKDLRLTDFSSKQEDNYGEYDANKTRKSKRKSSIWENNGSKNDMIRIRIFLFKTIFFQTGKY